MKLRTRFLIASLCLVLVMAVSFCVALIAGGASENSIIRLVSFDYIENTLLGYIDDKDEAAQKEIAVLKGRLLEAENEINELKEQLGAGGEYTSVTLLRGQSLLVEAGCELIVVSGRMEVSSGQLCDLTAGSLLAAEQSVECSHSTVAAEKTAVCASSGEVIILIRGEYTNG